MIALTTLGINSCQTPGLNEPDVVICTIIDNVTAECLPINGQPYDVKLIDLIGSQCVTPSDFAKIKLHHEALHNELNKGK